MLQRLWRSSGLVMAQSTRHTAWLFPITRVNLSQMSRMESTSSKGSAADYLVGLRGKPETQAEADAEAQAWLESFQSLRKDLKPNAGDVFEPSKAFAPEGAPENYTIFSEPDMVTGGTSTTIEFTEEQRAKAAALSDKPIPPMMDETMDYLANVIMRHGHKARAHRFLNRALYLVYLQTRQDPVRQLKDTLEKMAPLVRLKRYSDGGARAELVPVPLTQRQRLRQAWVWILEASNRRQSRDFSVRLAEEIVAAINGRSPGFEKKVTQHKTAVSNRAYVSLLQR